MAGAACGMIYTHMRLSVRGGSLASIRKELAHGFGIAILNSFASLLKSG